MGAIRNLVFALCAGTALGYLAYNNINRESERLGVEPHINSARRYVGLEDSVSQSQPLVQPVIQPQPQSQVLSEKKDLKRKVEPWNYHGLVWPKEWPIMDADGSYNRDYIRWYTEQSRGGR